MRHGLRSLMCGVAVCGVAVFGITPTATAAGNTLYVSPGGSGDCTSAASACSLQMAVAQANTDNGDTIVIADGTYTDFFPLDLTASMSLTAAPGAHPNLEGTADVNVIETEASVSISGLTVSDGDTGILVSAGSTTVANSTLTGNIFGIDSGGDSVAVTGSTITDSHSIGLHVNNGGAMVTNSTISYSHNFAIAPESDVSLTVDDSTISDTGVAAIFTDSDGTNIGLTGVILARNGRGCEITGASVATAAYNVESDDTCGFGATNVVGVGDAAIGLGQLAANGSTGPQTEAIDASSAAYHAVPVSSGPCPATDERGLPRPGDSTTACDAGAYELQRPTQTLTQTAPTSGTVVAGTAFADQLAVTGNDGATVTYTTTSGPSPVTVSATGTVSAPATTAPGVYVLTGTDTDTFGDTGTWNYTLTVTAAGPARADLSVKLHAPATAVLGASVPVTATVTNAGPATATKVGTVIVIPRGWTVTNAGGGTVVGKQLVLFTTPSLPTQTSTTYTITLKAPAKTTTSTIGAATTSTTRDPNYRNNLTGIVIRVH
jgi:hypothetical protein